MNASTPPPPTSTDTSTAAVKPPRTRRSRITRRALIAGGVAVGGCVAIGGAIAIPAALGPDTQSNLGELDFANELAIPPLADSHMDGGTRTFDLTLQTGETVVPGKGVSDTWGANGPLLGPTLRAAKGETVKIAVRNTLPEATSIHWHGMHLPAMMDGGPHQMLSPDATWTPSWTIEQPASTLWYHPHPHGQTAMHVYRGIAGLFLIDDDESAALDLPSEYGVDDVPLIIQDKRLSDSGQFDEGEPPFLQTIRGAGVFGILGNTIFVNGTYNPRFTAQRRLTRFRILNGSNTRFYNLGFTDDRVFHLVATDNGVLEAAVSQSRLQVGPGERVEIVVQMEPGKEATLRSYPQELHAALPVRRQFGGDDTFEILRIVAPPSLGRASRDLPETLIPSDPLQVPDDATRRSFELTDHDGINGQQMDMNRVDVAIPAGALEVWTITSEAMPHTFHIHGATFRVLDSDGEAPDVTLRGPKDTVPITPNRPVRLAVQFGNHIDPAMPYMYHCHLLRHEDNGMMGQFVVVEPGTEASTPMRLDMGSHRH